MMSQYNSTGLCVRSSSLNQGTTQSPRASISAAQPAFRGSSRSQRRDFPKFMNSTKPATTVTIARCRIVEFMNVSCQERKSQVRESRKTAKLAQRQFEFVAEVA